MKWATVSLSNIVHVLEDLALNRVNIKTQQVNISFDQYESCLYDNNNVFHECALVMNGISIFFI